MKNLTIILSLISSLLIGQLVSAEEKIKSVIVPIELETISVVSIPEVANFEIYSLNITESTLDSVMETVVDTITTSIETSRVSLIQTSETINTAT